MARENSAYAFIHLGGTWVPCGYLTIFEDGRQIVSTFQYGRKYLQRPDAMAIDPVAAYLEQLDQTVIATSEVDLDGVREHVRTMETNQGNLNADALLWQARQLAAEFDPVSIRNTARELNLHSDSSYRFERCVDSEQIDWASRRCAELILELAGGELAIDDQTVKSFTSTLGGQVSYARSTGFGVLLQEPLVQERARQTVHSALGDVEALGQFADPQLLGQHGVEGIDLLEPTGLRRNGLPANLLGLLQGVVGEVDGGHVQLPQAGEEEHCA